MLGVTKRRLLSREVGWPSLGGENGKKVLKPTASRHKILKGGGREKRKGLAAGDVTAISQQTPRTYLGKCCLPHGWGKGRRVLRAANILSASPF